MRDIIAIARSHITPYINYGDILKMEARRRLHLATLLFEVLKTSEPVYLSEKYQCSPIDPSAGYRASQRIVTCSPCKAISSRWLSNVSRENLSERYSSHFTYPKSLGSVSLSHSWRLLGPPSILKTYVLFIIIIQYI